MRVTPWEKAQSYCAALEKFRIALGPAWRVESRAGQAISWRMFVPWKARTPTQGWKIHISSAISDIEDLCQTVLPRLADLRTPFKIPATLDGVLRINSGIAGASQIGKIVTVYPDTDEAAAEIARQVDLVWPQTNGPPVASELAVRLGGAVYLRYGAFGTGQRIVTPRGLEFAICAPNGVFEPDDRSNAAPDWALPAPLPCELPEEPDFMQEFAFQDRSYLPIVLLHSSPKTKVFYGIATHDASAVFIKVVSSRTSEDFHGLNAGAKLAREFALLAKLHGIVPGLAPQPLDFHYAEHSVLVLAAIDGTSVEDLPELERIATLPFLAARLAQLHEAGYVHRDLKLCHVVQSEEHIFFVDFELAAPIGAMDFPMGGTHGYIAPEAPDGPAIAASDVYALGVCVAHAILGRDPASLPAGSGRLVGLLRLKGAREAGKLVKKFTDVDPLRRPSAGLAAAMLRDRRDQLIEESKGVFRRESGYRSQHWAFRAAIEAGLATREYSFLKSKGRSWRNTHLESNFDSEGINLGAAGIILGLMSLEEALGLRCFDEEILQGSNKLSSVEAPIGSCGLFTGGAGVALALTVCGLRLGHRELIDGARDRLLAAVSSCLDLDLFSGAAGIVWAGCLMTDILADAWPVEAVSPLAEQLLTGVSYEAGFPAWRGAASAWKAEDIVTGAAHGCSGIAMALAFWGRQCSNAKATSMARDTFRGLYRAARTEDGASLRLTLDGASTESGFWCHGPAGYLWCILQAFGDCPALRQEIDWAVGCLSSVPPIGNATYCHGISGQVEVWRMLRAVDRYRDVAVNRVSLLTDALSVLRQRRNELSVWCSESPSVITPDLWVGFLAPATTLALGIASRQDALLSSSWLRSVARVGADGCV